MNRLFVAAPIPLEIKEYIFNFLKSEIDNKHYNWESKDKMHITVKFLGDTENNKLTEIDRLLNTVSNNSSKFILELNKIGFFYKQNEPKVLWFNFKLNNTLIELNKKLETGFSEMGFEKENKKYNPHVTLLRIKPSGYSEELKKMESINLEKKVFEVDRIELIKSELFSKGSVYTKLKEYKLN